jgi:hypothetical protein
MYIIKLRLHGVITHMTIMHSVMSFPQIIEQLRWNGQMFLASSWAMVFSFMIIIPLCYNINK